MPGVGSGQSNPSISASSPQSRRNAHNDRVKRHLILISDPPGGCHRNRVKIPRAELGPFYFSLRQSLAPLKRLVPQLRSLERRLNFIQKSCPHRPALVDGVRRYRVRLAALAAGPFPRVFRIARTGGTFRWFGLESGWHHLSGSVRSFQVFSGSGFAPYALSHSISPVYRLPLSPLGCPPFAASWAIDKVTSQAASFTGI